VSQVGEHGLVDVFSPIDVNPPTAPSSFGGRANPESRCLWDIHPPPLTPLVIVFVHCGALEQLFHSTRSSGLKVTGVTFYSIIVTRFLMVEI
jgi:hypothetical protein